MIGAGAIGLEMAQFYRRMGSRVTVIEFGSQIAGHEDPEIADSNLARLLACTTASSSGAESLILFQATPARPAWADAGFHR